MKRVFGLLVMLGWLIVGCAVDAEPSVELPPLTLPPPLESTFSGSCTNSRLLEAWLQNAYFQSEEFVTLVNEASVKTPDELYADVTRMADLRNAVSTGEVPDCAVAAHNRLLEAMDAVIPDMVRYVNGETVDLLAEANEMQPLIAAFFEQHETLSARLEAQYRGNG